MESIILGIIQGLTEFLPVSSSAHLVVLGRLLGLRQDVALDAFLHLGTLCALILYFRGRIIQLILGIFGRGDEPGPARRWVGYILAGSVPIGLVGFFFRDWVEAAFAAPKIAAGMLLVTGALLLTARFARPRRQYPKLKDALIIGLAQAAALLPGISRSGATIAIALLLGLERSLAFEFSFLLSIPAVLGANLLQLSALSQVSNPLLTGLGGLMAFLIGGLSLFLLRSLVRRGELHWFGVYCFVIGSISLILL
jgi:undecaprenyl-diphosphatase